ncbi:hypothetical protein MMC17_005486 [Xylographa soralifera]|nr:hypothetical protein [Xylographa soralifera]
MANRRVPLSSVPNAGNSPFRAVAIAASKRSRLQSICAEEKRYDGPPPAKKQIVEISPSIPRTPPPRKQPQNTEGQVFNKRPQDSQLTAFDRKLLAVKERAIDAKVVKSERVSDEPMDTLRQWQNHYKRAFPSFVFYFESVPEDSRRQYSKQLHIFGAREEKFFSKEVTHIVTTRSAPVESTAATFVDKPQTLSLSIASQESSQLRTINPSLLEKSIEFSNATKGNPLKINKLAFGTTNTKTSRLADCQDVDTRRNYAGSIDILHRAKDMGIKIWQLEKFGRILHVMSDDLKGETQAQHLHNTRSNIPNVTKTGKEADLSRLIRNERLNGPADREAILATNDVVKFNGPYVYIRDMNEKCKPIMVREYPKVQHREEGAWPQFRSAPIGKCPFLEEVVYIRRDLEKGAAKDDKDETKDEEDEVSQRCKEPAPVASKGIPTVKSTSMQPPIQAGRKRPLSEMQQGENLTSQRIQQLPAAFSRDEPVEAAQDFQKTQKHQLLGNRPSFHGGEPMASGMQASNITSAIRSQMVSSTAAAPGAKAGTSKEVHGLQRKVLERNAGPSLNATGTAQQLRDIASNTRSLRNIAPTRIAKQKAQEKLGQNRLMHINEEMTLSEQEEVDGKAALKRSNAMKALRGEKREPKPGYCENCREKFEDFEEHTLGRKHRKFASTKENWRDLDDLLKELVRAPREQRNFQ